MNNCFHYLSIDFNSIQTNILSEMLSESEEEIRKELSKAMKLFECVICLNLMTDPMMTQCLHRFCSVCINKAIESSSSDCCRCPLCNEKITKRSLRTQTEVSEVIHALKAAIDSFERDVQMSVITDEEVVVFDVSTDKSKSCAQINDTIDESINESMKSKADGKSSDKSKESLNASTDVETTRKTTTITSSLDEWPTCETSNDVIEDTNNETEVYFDSTKTSLNGTANESCLQKSTESLVQTNGDKNCEVEANPTQSQNLRVKKSKITYSSSRQSINDKFDQIIRLSDYDISARDVPKRDFKSKPIVAEEYVSSESEPEIKFIESKPEVNPRKPLMHLKNKMNGDFDRKKKFKRIETLVSSDDDFSSPLVVNTKKRVPRIRDSDGLDIKSKNRKTVCDSDEDNDLSDEDIFLPTLNSNTNNSIEFNRNKDMRNESRNGYNSDLPLITSSPLSDDF